MTSDINHNMNTISTLIINKTLRRVAQKKEFCQVRIGFNIFDLVTKLKGGVYSNSIKLGEMLLMNIISNANYTRRQVMGGLVAFFAASIVTLPFLRSRNSELRRIRKTPLHSGDSIFAPRNDATLTRWLTGR